MFDASSITAGGFENRYVCAVNNHGQEVGQALLDGDTLEDIERRCAALDLMDALRDEAAGPMKGWDLVYVAYDDHLTDEQVAALVSGDMDTIWDTTSEWEHEQRWDSTEQIIHETLDRLVYDRNILDGTDEYDEARHLIEEHDTSDWLRQLVRNTSGPLTQQVLATDFDGHYLVSDAGMRAAAAEVTAALAPLGLPLTDRWRLAGRLLNEACMDYLWEHCRLVILHRADLDAIYRGDVESVTYTGAIELGIIDFANGSGWVDTYKLPAPVTLPVAAFPLEADGDTGYGWNDITGGVSLSYYDEPQYNTATRKEVAA